MSEQRKVERPMLVVTESKLAWNQFEKEKIGLSTVISTPQMLVLKALWGTKMESGEGEREGKAAYTQHISEYEEGHVRRNSQMETSF